MFETRIFLETCKEYKEWSDIILFIESSFAVEGGHTETEHNNVA